jgi:hypothetical protein
LGPAEDELRKLTGRLEDWKIGRLEGWKDGRGEEVEEWKGWMDERNRVRIAKWNGRT